MKKKNCMAADCNKLFDVTSYQKIFCSDRCRYRTSKRKTYKKRAEEGLCLQCGKNKERAISNKKGNVLISYCNNCQKYFEDRYKKRGNENE